MTKKVMANMILAAGMLTLGGSAFAATAMLTGDEAIAAKAAREIRMYPRYTIWDNINLQVVNGNLELNGQVSQPFKKADLGRLMKRVPGVTSVTNRLEVLPLSRFDDDIRIAVARAIYRDAALSRYAIQAVPPVHIIVKNGTVTLEGVVNNTLEKNIAGIRASGASLSFGPVVNNLRVENEKPRT